MSNTRVTPNANAVVNGYLIQAAGASGSICSLNSIQLCRWVVHIDDTPCEWLDIMNGIPSINRQQKRHRAPEVAGKLPEQSSSLVGVSWTYKCNIKPYVYNGSILSNVFCNHMDLWNRILHLPNSFTPQDK